MTFWIDSAGHVWEAWGFMTYAQVAPPHAKRWGMGLEWRQLCDAHEACRADPTIARDCTASRTPEPMPPAAARGA